MPARTGKLNRFGASVEGGFYRINKDGSYRQGFIDTDPYFREWLQTAKGFGYSGVAGNSTLRRELRRGSGFWYAYRTKSKKTFKVYVGRDEDITTENLRNANKQLNEKMGIERGF